MFARLPLIFAIGLAITASSAQATMPRGAAAENPGATATNAGPADPVLVFGAAAVALLVFCRTQQYLVPWFAIGTLVFGLMTAVYACLVGAWLLAFPLAGYAIACLCKWVGSSRRQTAPPPMRMRQRMALQPWETSRLSRMFGSLS